MLKCNVLIVGAGPVGLTLGLILARSGINFKIIDKDEAWSNQSRAMTITARTLEHLHTLGVSKKLVESGVPCYFVNFYYKTHLIGRYDFTPLNSQYNFILQIPQFTTTKFLDDEVTRQGVSVDRSQELISFKKNGNLFICEIQDHKNQKTIEVETDYLIACDGSRSKVRELDGIHFMGEVQSETTQMADLTMTNFPYAFNERHNFFIAKTVFTVLPIQKINNEYTYRIITRMISKKTYSYQEALEILKNDINEIGLKKVELSNPIWVTNFSPSQFVVSNFYHDHLAYVGDAAHIQNPIGAQGLNTGIQDAFNIGWKLVFILKHQFDDRLLQSYHNERYATAINLFNYNEKLSKVLYKMNKFKRLVNLFLKKLSYISYFNQKEIKLTSQFNVCYDKPLQKNANKLLKPGYRLPELIQESHSFKSFYDLLTPDKFLCMIFDNGKNIKDYVEALKPLNNCINIVVVSLKNDDEKKIYNQFHITEKTLCLIRPDTYVALTACGNTAPSKIIEYFKEGIYT